MIYRKIYSGLVFSVLLLVLIALAASGCKDNATGTNNGGGSTPPDDQVWMQNTKFNPQNKTISVGTKITWVNKDSFNHTVTSGTAGNPDGLFDSGTLGSGGTFSYTFNTAGSFNYYCQIHQSVMTGKIIVQ
jgi:plastocyanin